MNMLPPKLSVFGFFLFVYFFIFNNLSFAETNIMPEELIEHGKTKNCFQVTDFYEGNPGMRSPPFVYGYKFGMHEESAVFWCKKKGKKRVFTLMIFFRDSLENKDSLENVDNCPKELNWRNYPRGLSIFPPSGSGSFTNMNLERFRYLENPKRKGPKDVPLSHNGILDEYDGAGVIFYCHKDKWLIFQFD